MENNIFEGAKFGDRFVTRNDKQAIYIISSNMYPELGMMHDLVTEDATLVTVISDGFIDYEEHEEQDDDIVSRWEEIDEEKLDELAKEYAKNELKHSFNIDDTHTQCCISDFKAGYRKSKCGIE